MNCHGHDRRLQIVANYNISCIAHIRLLNGQTIRSDAERDITDTYYIFQCINKNNSKDIERIICGTGAAKDLLQIANIDAPPIFNKLHDIGGNNGGNIHVPINQTNTWNDAAKQLYNAIMILITAWNLKPGPMYDYLEQAKKYNNCTPYVNRIDKINQIIHKHNTSLRDILNQLALHNNIRNYNFDLLEGILHDNGILSYFEDANGR